eukprot:m.1304228 g.1304228  ORF g.1304228 m.1304228 type:complete len:63 (+) comp24811_c0_seq15:2182-2370(+)
MSEEWKVNNVLFACVYQCRQQEHEQSMQQQRSEYENALEQQVVENQALQTQTLEVRRCPWSP